MKLCRLTRQFSDIDYAYILDNLKHLKGIFGHLDGWWPSNTITKEENDEMLSWHETQFTTKQSFAYALFYDEVYSGCLCIYSYNEEISQIVDVPDENCLCVFFWTTEEMYSSFVDTLIFEEIKHWMEEIWYFATALYPGRTIPLKSYSGETSVWISTMPVNPNANNFL